MRACLAHVMKSWGLFCPPGPCIRGHAWLLHVVLGPFLARLAPASNAGMLGTWRLGPLSGPLGPRFAGMLGACVMVFMIFAYCVHIGPLVGSLCARMGKSWGHLGPFLDCAYCSDARSACMADVRNLFLAFLGLGAQLH